MNNEYAIIIAGLLVTAAILFAKHMEANDHRCVAALDAFFQGEGWFGFFGDTLQLRDISEGLQAAKRAYGCE